jgi:hypothetical protein
MKGASEIDLLTASDTLIPTLTPWARLSKEMLSLSWR